MLIGVSMDGQNQPATFSDIISKLDVAALYALTMEARRLSRSRPARGPSAREAADDLPAWLR